MTDLEAAARQIESAAHVWGGGGPEMEVFTGVAAGLRALGARVDALTDPTQEIRRTWREAARDAFCRAARERLQVLLLTGSVIFLLGAGAAGVVTWHVARSHGVCITTPVSVNGGEACWVRQ